MNILVLNYEFPPLGGGASPVSYEISKGYVENGHTVHVVTMGYNDLPDYEIVDGIHVHRVKCWRSKKEICYPWEQLTYIFAAKHYLKKLLAKQDFKVNHTHFIIPTGILAQWLRRKYKIPFFITSHGSDVIGYNRRFKRLYPLVKKQWKKVIKSAEFVITPSDFLKEKIEEKTTASNVKVIPNGINTRIFTPRKKEKVILIVARLFKNKGVQDILEALKDVSLSDWHIDIVGEGPFRKVLKSMIEKYNIKNTTFHGWIDNKNPKMKEFYGKATIFISASYFESFGQTVLEAISAGCFPLLSDIRGHRFIINDEQCFFKPGDISEIRSKIKDTITKKELPSLTFDIKKFEWNNIVKRYITVLETISKT